MTTLTNKVAIITGGIGGIGRGIVRHFLDLGAKVAVVDIVDQKDGEFSVGEMADRSQAIYLQKDIAIPENADPIIDSTVEHFGALHALINNAHASRQAPVMETTQEMWDLSLGTGMYATINLMRAAYPELKKVQGPSSTLPQVLH